MCSFPAYFSASQFLSLPLSLSHYFCLSFYPSFYLTQSLSLHLIQLSSLSILIRYYYYYFTSPSVILSSFHPSAVSSPPFTLSFFLYSFCSSPLHQVALRVTRSRNRNATATMLLDVQFDIDAVFLFLFLCLFFPPSA